MLWVRKACLLLLCTLLVSRAYAADEKDRQAQDLTGTPDDIAGPIVRATIDRAREAVIRQANLTGDSAEKKKTIAQILDEALEQEFPEEKAEGVGKNYNETAKQDDVRDPAPVAASSPCALSDSSVGKRSKACLMF